MYYWRVARRILGWWVVPVNNQSKPKNSQSIQFENLARLTISTMMKVCSSPLPHNTFITHNNYKYHRRGRRTDSRDMH